MLTRNVLQEFSLASQASTQHSMSATRTGKSGRPLLTVWENLALGCQIAQAALQVL